MANTHEHTVINVNAFAGGTAMSQRNILCIVWMAVFTGLMLPAAWAHESMPASLMLQQQNAHHFNVRWRIPQTQGQAVDIMPEFPSDCKATSPKRELPTPAARLLAWTIDCQTLLQSGNINIVGLDYTIMNVLVRVSYLDGRQDSYFASNRNPSIALARDPVAAPLAVSGYFALGVEHILSGIDHLLFVLCLMVLVQNARGLVKTITAFTLAHSITLTLSALQVVHVPQAPIEAAIALSIVFLAHELLQPRQSAKTWQRPWGVAFVFGLLHGFGFASALREIGLPPDAIVHSLLLFNLGIEAGQLLFVLGVGGLFYLLRLGAGRYQPLVYAEGMMRVPIYGIGAVAMYWFIARFLLILQP